MNYNESSDGAYASSPMALNWKPRMPVLTAEQEAVLNDPGLNEFLQTRYPKEPIGMPLLDTFLKAVELGMIRRASMCQDKGGGWRIYYAAGGDMNDDRLRSVCIADPELEKMALRSLPRRNKCLERKRKLREAVHRANGYR